MRSITDDNLRVSGNYSNIQRAMKPIKNSTISVEKALGRRRLEKRFSIDYKTNGLFFKNEI